MNHKHYSPATKCVLIDIDDRARKAAEISKLLKQKIAVIGFEKTAKILENLHVDKVHILVDGKIIKTGDSTLASEIEKNGYKEYIK